MLLICSLNKYGTLKTVPVYPNELMYVFKYKPFSLIF